MKNYVKAYTELTGKKMTLADFVWTPKRQRNVKRSIKRMNIELIKRRRPS